MFVELCGWLPIKGGGWFETSKPGLRVSVNIGNVAYFYALGKHTIIELIHGGQFLEEESYEDVSGWDVWKSCKGGR